MTETFSSNSFVTVGPNSDWSKTFSPAPTSKENTMKQVWSNNWDISVSTTKPQLQTEFKQNFSGFKTTWEPNVEHNVASPKSTNLVKTPSNAFSTTWDITLDSQSKSILSPKSQTQKQPPLQIEKRQQEQNATTVSPVKSQQQQQEEANEQQNQSHEVTKQSLYKTELCRSWIDRGICKYGHKCQFAHGEEELRIVARHPKYKTEPCKTFISTGNCPYGNRCRFIHPPSNGFGRKQFKGNNNQQQTQQLSSILSPASPSGSITPPISTFSSDDSPLLDVNQLLDSLPGLEDEKTEEEHRLSFFRNLTDE